MSRKRKALVEQESGWLREFTPNDDGTYTMDIAFKPETRIISDEIKELCRGVQYWSVTLDAATAEALGQAFENGAQISYDPKTMRCAAYHRVPWQTFAFNPKERL